MGLPERGGERRERERVLRRISQGLTLRRLGPRLRPRGGDRRSHYPSRPPWGRVSNPVPGFPRAPRPTSQFPVPTAPRAARCDLEAADPGRPLAASPLLSSGVCPGPLGRGGERYFAPSTSRELGRNRRSVLPPPPTRRWCQSRPSAPHRGAGFPRACRASGRDCNPSGAGARESQRDHLSPAVLAGCAKLGAAEGRVEGQVTVLVKPPGRSGRQTDPSAEGAWGSAGSLVRTAEAWAPLERPGGLPGGSETELSGAVMG